MPPSGGTCRSETPFPKSVVSVALILDRSFRPESFRLGEDRLYSELFSHSTTRSRTPWWTSTSRRFACISGNRSALDEIKYISGVHRRFAADWILSNATGNFFKILNVVPILIRMPRAKRNLPKPKPLEFTPNRCFEHRNAEFLKFHCFQSPGHRPTRPSISGAENPWVRTPPRCPAVKRPRSPFRR